MKNTRTSIQAAKELAVYLHKAIDMCIQIFLTQNTSKFVFNIVHTTESTLAYNGCR